VLELADNRHAPAPLPGAGHVRPVGRDRKLGRVSNPIEALMAIGAAAERERGHPTRGWNTVGPCALALASPATDETIDAHRQPGNLSPRARRHRRWHAAGGGVAARLPPNPARTATRAVGARGRALHERAAHGERITRLMETTAAESASSAFYPAGASLAAARLPVPGVSMPKGPYVRYEARDAEFSWRNRSRFSRNLCAARSGSLQPDSRARSTCASSRAMRCRRRLASRLSACCDMD
jgi:hypothetical protein